MTALVRLNELGLAAREAPSAMHLAKASRWRARGEVHAFSAARAEAVRLATRSGELDKEPDSTKTRITELVKVGAAAPMLEVTGLGVVMAATCLAIWSPEGRCIRNAVCVSLPG